MSALGATLFCISYGAGADDATQASVTIGLKAWGTEWTSWEPYLNKGADVRIIEPVSSGTEVALIPQASVRYGDWLGSASYFVNKTYSLSGAIDPLSGNTLTLSPTRKEFDVNGGYYIFPSLAVTLGYKHIEQDFGTASYKWSGPTLGLSASAVLHPNLALYGAFSLGLLRLNASTPDDAGKNSFDAIYSLGELGLAYVFNTGLPNFSLTLTGGYRVQIVDTRNFSLATAYGGYSQVELHDVTQGPVISLIGRF
jgi:hypothetical protein